MSELLQLANLQAPEGWSGKAQQDEELKPQLQQAKSKEWVLQGVGSAVEQVNIGGDKTETCLIVMVGSIKAYLPQSYAATKVNLRNFIDKQIEFVIEKMDLDNGLMIINRAKALEKKAQATWENLEEGQVRPAKVKVVTERGVMADIGGVLARIPRKELSWGYIEPSKAFKPGQELMLKIIRVDKENKKVAASLRAMMKNPWENISDLYRVNGEYKGVVTGYLNDPNTGGGIFVNLDSGVSVLCEWPALALPKVGDKVIVRIRGINPEKKRMTGQILRPVS
ncbi:MAG: 30S ribosomal protein S1 [Syntrophothermus sp.]|uniref:S1 RNA-binding domain-containing protein n=1 Tax=Syntrophothermus sp. TaxID=2736299 RepID=UPI00257BDB69|nr:S1 RNA-binding domain-containing protein [Syntrophothermus sp.]NSW83629.1 30S ribosomal protein S1 [Syntrophothermus sp.]